MLAPTQSHFWITRFTLDCVGSVRLARYHHQTVFLFQCHPLLLPIIKRIHTIIGAIFFQSFMQLATFDQLTICLLHELFHSPPTDWLSPMMMMIISSGIWWAASWIYVSCEESIRRESACPGDWLTDSPPLLRLKFCRIYYGSSVVKFLLKCRLGVWKNWCVACRRSKYYYIVCYISTWSAKSLKPLVKILVGMWDSLTIMESLCCWVWCGSLKILQTTMHSGCLQSTILHT